jgi:hypothetical protein
LTVAVYCFGQCTSIGCNFFQFHGRHQIFDHLHVEPTCPKTQKYMVRYVGFFHTILFHFLQNNLDLLGCIRPSTICPCFECWKPKNYCEKSTNKNDDNGTGPIGNDLPWV